MIYCPECGTGNREGSRYCNQCGARISDQTPLPCPRCGAGNLPDMDHCQECGLDLAHARGDEEASLLQVSEEPEEGPGGLPPWLDRAMSTTGDWEQEEDELGAEFEVEGPAPRMPHSEWSPDAIPIEPVVGVPYRARERAEVPAPAEQVQAAQLFAAVAAEEVHAAPQPLPRSRRPQPLASGLRPMVAALLLLAVLVPLLLPLGPYAQGQALASQAVAATARAVGEVPVGSVVLVAFEYDAALAGELDVIADALLGQLLGQGAHVLVVGTQPEGAALGALALERALDRTEGRYGVDALHLGFVAGGEAAVRALGVSIPAAVAVDYVEGQPLARWPVGQDLGGARELPLVVVLGRDLSAVQRWIEQVHAPYNTPLIAGVPALVAPALEPYQAAGQLRGIVAGIEGAAAYERLLGTRRGTASALVPSVRLGIWAVVMLVVLVNLATLVDWWRRRRSS